MKFVRTALALSGSLLLATTGTLAAAKSPTAPAPTPTSAESTSFRVASFNVLGSNHTDGNPPARKGYDKSPVRLQRTLTVLRNQKIGVVGFQELHRKQALQWDRIAGSEWDTFPGTQQGDAAGHNSISWRRDTFRLIERRQIKTPYFKGNMLPMPYVLLEHVTTGERAWFFNVHNPANTRGPAQKWRNKATKIEADLVNSLRAADPTTPVFLTGDMNDREKFFCKISRLTDLRSANGGWGTSLGCAIANPSRVDWVLGTPDVAFSNYRAFRSKTVKRTTDHHVIIADATIAPRRLRESGVDHVVLLQVDGITRNTLKTNKFAPLTPHMRTMLAQGTGTVEARTAAETSHSLPNAISLVTGLRVKGKAGGHGNNNIVDRGDTVHRRAGRYIPSIFDAVHDDGRRTALYSGQAAGKVLTRSWGSAHGAVDRITTDQGRNKFSTQVLSPKGDGKITKAIRKDFSGGTPAALSLVQFGGPERSGAKKGWNSSAYKAAVKRADERVGQILQTISQSPQAATTLVILTSATGGKPGKGKKQVARSYRVPMIAWGAGVPAGGDLYDLNPQMIRPSGRGSYGAQPVFVASLSNMVLGTLGLTALPGSLDQRQQATVFAPPPALPVP